MSFVKSIHLNVRSAKDISGPE